MDENLIMGTITRFGEDLFPVSIYHFPALNEITSGITNIRETLADLITTLDSRLEPLTEAAAGTHDQLLSISGITGNMEQITEEYKEILETINTNAAELTAPINEFNETIGHMNHTLWTVNDNLVTIGGQIQALYIVIIVTVAVAVGWKIIAGILFRGA